MKKKKLSARQKAINRIQRRLKTKQARGEEIKINPTKENIKEILKQNNIKITNKNANDVVNDVVHETSYHFKNTKGARKALGVETAAEARALSGQEIRSKIKDLYDQGEDDMAETILEAYGYGN